MFLLLGIGREPACGTTVEDDARTVVQRYVPSCYNAAIERGEGELENISPDEKVMYIIIRRVTL